MPAGKPNIGLLSSANVSIRSAQSDYAIEDPVLEKISNLAIGMIGITNYLIESHEVKVEINEEFNIFNEVKELKNELTKLANTLTENSITLNNEITYMNQTMNMILNDVMSIKEKIE